MRTSMFSIILLLTLFSALGAQAVNPLELEWHQNSSDVAGNSLGVSLQWKETKARSDAFYVSNVTYTVEYSTEENFSNAKILQTKEKNAYLELTKSHDYYMRVRASWDFYRYPHRFIGEWSNAIVIAAPEHHEL